MGFWWGLTGKTWLLCDYVQWVDALTPLENQKNDQNSSNPLFDQLYKNLNHIGISLVRFNQQPDELACHFIWKIRVEEPNEPSDIKYGCNTRGVVFSFFRFRLLFWNGRSIFDKGLNSKTRKMDSSAEIARKPYQKSKNSKKQKDYATCISIKNNLSTLKKFSGTEKNT